jgi:beta-xylosidase
MTSFIRHFPVVITAVMLFVSACAPAVADPTATTVPPPTETFTPVPTVTLIPPTATSMPTAAPTEIPVFWDDFDKELLPGWTWIRENDALWSLDSEPGYLRIVLTGDNPHRNLLIRDVGQENFQIMTRVRFKPTSNYQIAGLLVYQDDNTRAVLGRAYCDRQNVCVGNGIYFDATLDGQLQGGNFATDTQIKDEAYLRIDKNGTKLTGNYSENGTDWMMIGEHELPMTDPKVGILTGQSQIVGMPAYFDYYTVMEMP